MTQETDIYGAADWLGITVATTKRRQKAGTFPKPDYTDRNDGTEWWSIQTLDKYQKALNRKKNARKKLA